MVWVALVQGVSLRAEPLALDRFHVERQGLAGGFQAVQELVNRFPCRRPFRPPNPEQELPPAVKHPRRVRLPGDKVRARPLSHDVLLNQQGARYVEGFGLKHKKGAVSIAPSVSLVPWWRVVHVDSLELEALPGRAVTLLNRGHFGGSVDGKSGGNDRGEKKEFHKGGREKGKSP